MKRTFDLIVSALCLIIFSPLILLCAIAIRLDDGLPVIYTQERIGRNGKPFFIYKFRTMRMDAEENGPMVLEVDGDDRLTRVGKFLREHHLDELPHFGTCSKATWPSLVHVQSAAFTSIRLWQKMPAMSNFTPYDRA